MAGFIPTGCTSGPAASNEAPVLWAVINGPSLPDPWAVPRTLKAEVHRVSEGALGMAALSNAARVTFCGETVCLSLETAVRRLDAH